MTSFIITSLKSLKSTTSQLQDFILSFLCKDPKQQILGFKLFQYSSPIKEVSRILIAYIFSMHPRRANETTTNNNNNTYLVALLTQLVNQLAQANNNNSGSATGGGTNPPPCTFKHFNSCNPIKFYGTEGATCLLQWFEGIENTFLNSDCPDNLRVHYATSVFKKRALTWWDGEKRNRGVDVTMALPWDEVKRLMAEEFCPRNEMKKLDADFWDLTQHSGENLVYTTRFQELSLLVPHMVTPLNRCIEKYIGGLPMKIHDTVLEKNPTTLEDDVRLAATLTDNHVKAGTLTRKDVKKFTSPTTSSEPSKEDKPKPPHNNKKRNFAVVTPAVPINQVAPLVQNQNKKPYVGNNPLCNTCNYHHFPNMPCRLCANCGRYSHVANTCQSGPPVGQVN
ncbi:hypothetical protein L1987_59995 [Smallanthus sonchifolius]|uniref:Uncharacterized protein n=1 Tax=Smallanthus sonchifolius TaxID=185202 RepID=A0ACB9D730_9ASTR|nr:hypothetical protein L1987_59995 [Smallanthus sonchifolius]